VSALNDHLKVFVSFSSRDGLPHAYRLAEWLRTVLGASPFVYYERPPGEHFPTTIQRAIRECRVLLALITPGYSADDSVICEQELSLALKLGRAIVPVRMLAGTEAPLLLNQFVRLELTSADHPDWARLEAELRMLASPERQLDELGRGRDLWMDRRPPAGPLRELWERNILGPIDRQIADQKRRLALDAGRNLADDLAAERARPDRPHSRRGQHTRFLSSPPAVAPSEFQNRVAERDRLLDAVRAGHHRFVLLLGKPGSGKTAILAKLAEAIQGADGAGVDWFAYLPSFGQNEVSPATLLNALARIADGDDEYDTSQRMLHDNEVSWRAAADDILGRIGTQRVVLVLDNVEQLTDRSGRLTDTELGHLLHRISDGPRGVTFVLASTGTIDLRSIPVRMIERIPLDPGLEPTHGAEFLRSLDPDGLRGLGSATESERKHLSYLGNGHPRTLELVVALLYCEEQATVADVINSLEFDLNGATPAEFLINRILDVLPELDRSVLTALAVFGEPVRPTAVDFLLAPYLQNLHSASTLALLCDRRLIRAHADRFHLYSAEEAEVVLSGVPLGDPDDEPNVFRWTQTDLALTAAEYHSEMAMPDPTRVEDLRPQFSEVEQRIRGGDPVGAAVAIERMDDRCLQSWGQTYLVMPWLRRLQKRLISEEHRVPVMSMLVNGHLQIGEYLEAAKLIKDLEPLVSALSQDRVVQFYVQAGSATYQHGQVTEAAKYYRSALERTGPDDWLAGVRARSGLALCATGAGNLAGANGHLAAARELLAPHPGEISLTGQLDLNEAWLRGFEGNWIEARERWESARKISRDRGQPDTELEAWTYCAEASHLIDEGKYKDAVKPADRAIALAAPRHNMRILREAKNRIVLAHLCENNLPAALAEARFATSIVQRHGALPAFTLYGLTQLRLEDADAGATLSRARALAEDYLQVEKSSFEVWDLLGVVLLAQSMDDQLAYEERMVAAFQEARKMTSAAGAVGRVHLLIDQVAKAFAAPLPELAMAAATAVLPA
jgi:tetratricopeptide (TPR) repeat protein